MKKILLSEQKQSQLVSEISNRLIEMRGRGLPHLRGEEITEFAPHKQLNQFLLFQIYQDWNSQVAKLHHPFFDFDHEEVKEGLKRFTSVISRHIRISREEFRPLLDRAVFNNLRLILNPEDAFLVFFFGQGDRIPVDVFQRFSPYFSDFDFVIQSLQKYFEKQNLGWVEKGIFSEKMGKVLELFESKPGNSIQKYQAFLFQRLTGRDLETVIGKEPPPSVQSPFSQNPVTPPPVTPPPVTPPPVTPPPVTPPPVTPPPVTPPPVTPPPVTPPPVTEEEKPMNLLQSLQQQNQKKSISDLFKKSGDDLPLHQQFSKQEEPAHHEPVSLEPPVSDEKSTEEVAKVEMPVVEIPETPAMPEVVIEKTEESQPMERPIDLFSRTESPVMKEAERLLDSLAGNRDTLNQKLSGSLTPENIPVHKQFQYVQKVFAGSSVKFKVVLDKINKAQNWTEAEEILNKYVLNAPEVNPGDKVTQEFIQMVRGQFH